jgi:hypothetical protein
LKIDILRPRTKNIGFEFHTFPVQLNRPSGILISEKIIKIKSPYYTYTIYSISLGFCNWWHVPNLHMEIMALNKLQSPRLKVYWIFPKITKVQEIIVDFGYSKQWKPMNCVAKFFEIFDPLEVNVIYGRPYIKIWKNSIKIPPAKLLTPHGTNLLKKDLIHFHSSPIIFLLHF